MLKINNLTYDTYVEFTPAFFKRAYKNYRSGNYRDLIALFDRVESDAYVSGCLTHRNAGYKRSWQIVPASEAASDVAIAEKITGLLNEYPMRNVFEEIIDARMKKFSVIGYEDWGVVAGLQAPAKFKKYHQKYFGFDSDGVLKIYTGYSSFAEIGEDEALVCLSPKIPILLPVAKEFIRMNFGKDVWSAFIENFGEPIITLSYPPGDDAKKSEAETTVNTIGRSTRIAKPSDTELDVVATNKSSGDHAYYVNDSKEAISFKLLGHTEAAGGGNRKAQIGENQTTLKVSEKIAVDDMFFIEEQFQPFIDLIVKKNFNAGRAPKLLVDKSFKLDPKVLLSAADQAYDQGAGIAVNWYKENFGVELETGDDNEFLKKQSFPD